MYFVYVLRSGKDGRLYTGVTNDLGRRLNEHRRGKVKSTQFRRPLDLVYQQRFSTKSKALARERYFKTAEGGSLKQRLMKDAEDWSVGASG